MKRRIIVFILAMAAIPSPPAPAGERSGGVSGPEFLRTAAAEGPVVRRLASRKGEVVKVAPSGRRVGRLKSRIRGDELGSDTDADGVPGTDLGGCVFGAPGWSASIGRLAVYECASDAIAGRFLYSIEGNDLAGGAVGRFSESLMVLGHVDNNYSHWAVGAPGLGQSGGPDSAVVVLDGSFAERMRLTSPPEARLGWTLAGVGLDGFFTSFAAGAPGQARGSRKKAGAVHLVDTVSGEVLWTLLGSSRGQYLGYSMAVAGDVDGDAVSDLLIGAPGRPSRKPAGEVWMVSGRDGQVIRRFIAPSEAVLFGFAVDGNDVDGDGLLDVIVSAPRTPAAAGEDVGVVYVFDLNGEMILRWEGERAGQWLGVDVAAVFSSDDAGGFTMRHIAASSLFVDKAKPKRNRRGGLEFLALDSEGVVGRRLGKRADDRLGWRILSCFNGCRIQVPKSPGFFVPE